MQFHEKLKAYRSSCGLTQEQLAEKVFVSRVTISKWETGRGLPNLGSLQQLSSLFGISVDELLGSNELVALAQSEVRQTTGQRRILLFGILDFLMVPLLFLPLYTDGKGHLFTLSSFYTIGSFQQPIFTAMIVLLCTFGVAELALQTHLSDIWKKRVLNISLAFALLFLLLFVNSRQPYPSTFVLCLVVAKGFILIKRR